MTVPLSESYREIPLTKGQVALVDPEDYERVLAQSWSAVWNNGSKTFYGKCAFRQDSGKIKSLNLHRFIMGVTDRALDVDHRDHNGLDCRKCNLRICTRSQNAANARTRLDSKSGFKGVYWRQNRWQARTTHNYKHIFIGSFFTKEDAARAYDRKAIELFGEFAHLNFPLSDYAS